MFKVQTPKGPRYMVVLVGPKSYRLGDLYITRGGVVTVTKKTRDYLVSRTRFFADYDPSPAEPIEEILPPQFGENRKDRFDASDFDKTTNPPLTQAQAAALAAKGGLVDQNDNPVQDHDDDDDEDDGAPKANPADFLPPSGSGDLTSADLKKAGISTPPKKTGVKVTGKAMPPSVPSTKPSDGATTVS